MPPSTTGFPILLKFGTVIEGATDLELVGPGMTWTQSRSYNSGLEGGGAFGNRWMNNNTAMYLVSTDTGKDVIYTATAKYSFAGTDSAYTPPTGIRLTLEHKSGPQEYWLTNLDTHALVIFHDFTVTDTTETSIYDRGKLKAFTSVDWNAADQFGMKYKYSYTDTVLDSVTITTSGEQAFSVTSSFDAGRLKSLSVHDGTTLTQKVEYFYFEDIWVDDSLSAHSDTGDAGDLVHVKVSNRAAGDTGNDLSIVRHTLYRYGTNSRLKGVYDHASVMRALAHFGETDPQWLLTQPDDHQLSGMGPKIEDYASRWFTYYDSDFATNTSITTIWGSENLESTYGGSNRDETNFVRTERVGAGQCTSCGGGNSGVTHEYYYFVIDQSANGIDGNEVTYLVVEDTKDSAAAMYRKVYGLNADGRRLREVFIDNPASSPKYWCQSWILNPTSDWSGDSKPEKRYTLSEYRPPSAHKVTTANVAQFLNPYDDGGGQWGNDTATLLSTSDTSPAAGPTFVYRYTDDGFEKDRRVKRGSDSTDLYFLSATDYGTGGMGYPTYLPTTYYVYPTMTTDRNTAVLWTMDYEFWDMAKVQLRKATTTYPAISTSQNGSGVAATAEGWYDKPGRLRWEKDPEGYVMYHSYEKVSGQLAYTAVDVNPASMPSSATTGSILLLANDDGDGNTTYDSSGIPSRDSGLPSALALVTQQVFDAQGRQTLLTNPGGDRHATVYKSDRTIQFPYLNTSGYPQMPIQVQVLNNAAQTTKTFAVRANYTSIGISSNVPTGFSTEPGVSDYVALAQYAYDDETGNLTQVDQYHTIPTSLPGTISDNFYRTVFQYDVQGRRTYTIQQVSGAPGTSGNGVEQVTKAIYDTLDRVTEIKRGVSAAGSNMGTSYNNYPTLATVSKTYYDGGDDTTPLKVGNGQVTSTRRFYGSSDYIETLFKRTYRGDLRGIEQTNNGTAFNPRTVMDVNWLGSTIGSALYTSSVTWTDVLTGDGYANYLSGHSTGRNEWTKSTYNDIGQVCRVERYPGSESTKHFETNSYYDRMGRVVATGDKYSANREYAYDGAGRQYQQRTIVELASPNMTYGQYTSGGEFAYVAPAPKPALSSMSSTGDNGLIQFSHAVYDVAGNSTERHSFELNHTDTDGIDIDATNSYVRRSVFDWYDTANRLSATADYGSSNGTSGSTSWAYSTRPSRPSEPAWTDSLVYNGYVHLMKLDYDGTSGRMDTVTAGVSKDGTNSDTKKIVTKTFSDALGRRIAVAENWVNATANGTNAGGGTNNEEDRVTKFTYNGLGQQTQITAVNVTSGGAVNEVTKYLYEDAANASLVTSAIYPDSTDTDSSGTNQVKTSYNLDGSPATRTDQRGVVHSYAHDEKRMLKADKVTSFGSTGIVDNTVKSITRAYDTLGRPVKVTSHGNATDDPTNTTDIKNQVVYTIGTQGLVTKTEQSHADAVTPSTANVERAYDDHTTSNVYDNGLRLQRETYPSGRYALQTYGSGDVSDALNRVSGLSLNPSGPAVSYAYNGVSHVVKVAFSGGTSLKHEMFNLDSAGANVYNGWDQFGEVVDHRWLAADQVKYAYDYAGNRLTRDVVSTFYNTRDQKYSYDGFQRLLAYDQGTLSSGSISSSSKQRSWKLDQMGNWAQTFSDLSQTTSEQTRTHNEANELTQINSSGSHVGEDAAGNMTKIPKPISWSAHYDLKYDAWNRLVDVKDGSNTVQENQYDGLGRRVVRSIYDSDILDHRIHDYYNDEWQLLEEFKEVSDTVDENALSSYLWHPYYIDALAVREYDPNVDGNFVYQFYLHDANYNVTSVSDGTQALERYSYSPYGEVTFLNSDYSTKSTQASDIGNAHQYTGREIDPGTGLQLNRHRFYVSWLGRWISRDPIEYETNDFNLFEYEVSDPMYWIDPFGLIITPPNPSDPNDEKNQKQQGGQGLGNFWPWIRPRIPMRWPPWGPKGPGANGQQGPGQQGPGQQGPGQQGPGQQGPGQQGPWPGPVRPRPRWPHPWRCHWNPDTNKWEAGVSTEWAW